MSHKGTVKRFDRKRGFGFIKPKSGGKDLFIHWNDIVSEDKWPALKMNMEIKYDTKISEKDGKEVACNVTDANGGAIALGEATEHKLSTFTAKGTVKYFAKKGFGFIETASKITWPKKLPAGSDIYVSRENLICAEGSVCTLRRGSKVAFKVFAREGQDTLAAAEVTDEEGNPLNYEAREPGEKKAMKRFKGKKGKGKGKSKGGGKGAKKVISKFAKATAQKLTKKPKGKGGGGDEGGSKIVKMGKYQKPSKGSGKGEGKIVKQGKGGTKGKGVKKPQFQKQNTKIVYVEVPVYQDKKKGKQNSKGSGKGGSAGSKGGKSKGGWQLVPKKKTKVKQEFW